MGYYGDPFRPVFIDDDAYAKGPSWVDPMDPCTTGPQEPFIQRMMDDFGHNDDEEPRFREDEVAQQPASAQQFLTKLSAWQDIDDTTEDDDCGYVVGRHGEPNPSGRQRGEAGAGSRPCYAVISRRPGILRVV